MTEQFFNYKEVYIEVLFESQTYNSCILPILQNGVSKHAVLRSIDIDSGSVIISLTDHKIEFHGFYNGDTNVYVVNILVRS